MSIANPIQASYDRERDNYNDYAPGGPKALAGEKWLDSDSTQQSVDSWRHHRFYATLDPLLCSHPRARWLTVGDGRYGRDAQYLQSRGGKVVATDIAGVLLAEAKRRGAIDDFKVENAEHLSFADESFDLVLCKESYHHFPRPMLALYEMLRVARVGIALIEPFDRFTHSPLPEATWNWIKSLPRRLSRKYVADKPFRFEPVGNFIYTISEREIEKAAMALDLPCVAFRGLNDHYIAGVENEPAESSNKVFKQVRSRIARLDLLCKLRLRQPQILTALILKQAPSHQLRQSLEKAGYSITDLPLNPYRKESQREAA